VTAGPALRPGRPKADRDTLRSNHVSPLTTPPPRAHLLCGLDLPHERRNVTVDIKGLHLAFIPLTPSFAVVRCGRALWSCDAVVRVSRYSSSLWWTSPYQGWILRYPKAGRGVPLRAPETDPSFCRVPGGFAVSGLLRVADWPPDRSPERHGFDTGSVLL
jgi:hypothetical protein